MRRIAEIRDRFLTRSARVILSLTLTNGWLLGVNVLTGVVTARLLGAQGRGELAALLLWPQLLGYAFAFALPTAVVYHAQSDPARRREIVGAALVLGGLGGALAWAAGAVAMPWLLPHAPPATLETARWLMAFAPFATLSTVLVALLQLADRFTAYNRIRYLPPLATLAALLLLAWTGELSPLGAALGYLVPGVPVFAWLVWWTARNVRPSLRGAGEAARRLLSYGGRAYGGEAAGTLLAQADKALLVTLLAPAAYGVYVVAFNLSRMLTLLASAIVPVLLPKSAGKTPAEVTAITSRALAVSTPLVVLGALLFALLGGPVLRALYGAEFSGGEIALDLLGAEAALASVVYLLVQPYLALNRPGVITAIQIGALPVLAAAIVLLVPRFGIEGAAAAVLLATAARALGVLGAYRRILQTALPRLWPSSLRPLALLRDARELP